MAAPRILIADDHPLFREAMRHVLGAIFPVSEIVEVRTFADAREALRGEAFELIVADLIMPGGGDPLDEIGSIRSAQPSTPLVVVSSREDWPTIRALLVLGVAGFIPKSAPKGELERAIRAVLAGGVYAPAAVADVLGDAVAPPSEPLTPRQAAVLERLARGRSNRQIAEDLHIEEITVKVHISAILRKLRVKNRLEAVLASRALLGRSVLG